MQEVISFYKGLDVPTRQILDSKGAIPTMKAVDAKKAIQGEKPRMGYQIEASMNVHDSDILKDFLPPKEKDPWSFTIPCLGGSARTKLIIELADRTKKHHKRERNQVEDLSPTVKEGEEIDEPMEDIVKTRNDEISKGIEEYPSFYNCDENIHMDYAYNLQFSCMIVIENMDAYRDEGMGDVIVGKPFCREICVKTRRLKE
ncbi:hypothetical protein Tco_0496293 [Tanacetum coccineum]